MKKNNTLTRSTDAVRKLPQASKLCTALLLTAALLITFIGGCKKDDFEGEVAGVCPVVVSDPIDQAVDVALDKLITITFNTDMDSTSINSQTFFIKQGATLIPGKISTTADPKVFTFKPNVALNPFVLYSGTVNTGAKDRFRSAMVTDYLWSFTTIPLVSLSSNPVIGGTTAGGGTFIEGSSVTVTAVPSPGYAFANWTSGAVVSPSPSFQFTMAGNKTLVANFTLIPAGNFAVILSSNPVAGGVTIGSGSFAGGSLRTVKATANAGYTFTNWTDKVTGLVASPNSSYTFILIANRTLVANFSTNVQVGVGPGPIDLGTAGEFGILTKSGISTNGVTSITGDIGVSPAAATAITGFGLIMDTDGQSSHTPIVTGKVYAADYAAPTPTKMTTAISDMETAFTTANGLVTPAPIVGLYNGDISGRVLTPGLYKWATGVLITNAGVTLTGGANDTWVFQISQDLIVNSSAIITLGGQAQAKNIFWVVSGQANLDTNVDFKGIILSKTLISLKTGAKLKGRLLAQTAVTLDANTITTP